MADKEVKPKKKVNAQAKGRVKKAAKESANARLDDRKLESGRDGSYSYGGPKTGYSPISKRGGPLSGQKTAVRSGTDSSKTYLTGKKRKSGNQFYQEK